MPEKKCCKPSKMERKKDAESIKQKLFLWGRNKKVRTRVAINFGFEKNKTEESKNSSENIIQTEDKSKVLEKIEVLKADSRLFMKDALNKNNSAIRDESSLQDDDAFGLDLQDIIDPFLIPFYVTEDHLSGTSGFSSARSPLITPRSSVVPSTRSETPPSSNRTLRSTSRFLSAMDVDYISLMSTKEEDDDDLSNFDFSDMSGQDEAVHSTVVPSMMSGKERKGRVYRDDYKGEGVGGADGSNRLEASGCMPLPGKGNICGMDESHLKSKDAYTHDISQEDSMAEFIGALRDNLETDQMTECSALNDSLDDKNYDVESTSTYFDPGDLSTPALCFFDPNAPWTENSHPEIARRRATLLLRESEDLQSTSGKMASDDLVRQKVESRGCEETCSFFEPFALVVSRCEILKRRKFTSRSSESMHNRSVQTDSSLADFTPDISAKSSSFSETVLQMESRRSSCMQHSRSLHDTLERKDARLASESLIRWSGEAPKVNGRRDHSEKWFGKNSEAKARENDASLDSSFSDRSEVASSGRAGQVSPDLAELSRWKLEKLEELERRKMAIMNMCQRDIELMYLRGEERQLKIQLRKVRSRMRQLESLEDVASSPRNESISTPVDPVHLESKTPEQPEGERVERDEPFDDPGVSVAIKDFHDASQLEPDVSRLGGCHNDDRSPSASACTDRSIEDSPPSEAPVSSRVEQKRRAAFETLCLRLGPVVKGYVVRRLLECNRVKDLVRTIKDTRKEIEFIRLTEGRSEGDRRRAGRSAFEDMLCKQLLSRSRELFEIFFSPSPTERLGIIALQRAKDLSKKFQKAPKKQQQNLSLGTRKSIDRKRRIREMEMALPSAAHRPASRARSHSTATGGVPGASESDGPRRNQIERSGNPCSAHSVDNVDDSGARHSCQRPSTLSRTSKRAKTFIFSKNNAAYTRARVRPNK